MAWWCLRKLPAGQELNESNYIVSKLDQIIFGFALWWNLLTLDVPTTFRSNYYQQQDEGCHTHGIMLENVKTLEGRRHQSAVLYDDDVIQTSDQRGVKTESRGLSDQLERGVEEREGKEECLRFHSWVTTSTASTPCWKRYLLRQAMSSTHKHFTALHAPDAGTVGKHSTMCKFTPAALAHLSKPYSNLWVWTTKQR